ncbi:MAG TPA: GTPase Era [Alphaproteobacteria bacterium]|jgi:GTPase|nr:GTPase Era [Alphaproteobacteria bacterium]
MNSENVTHCGFVALIGPANAGKSTLLNSLTGEKLSIVTHKAQTTRMRVRGIALVENTQIVFVDTPGIFKPQRRLDRAMVQAAWESMQEADSVVLVIDAARGLNEDAKAIMEGLQRAKRSAVLALNKIDLLPRENLLPLTNTFNESGLFTRTFLISARSGDGVEDLRAFLAHAMPSGAWLYPEDQLSDLTERLMASEITREKIFLRLHEELPYDSTVETEAWKELKDGGARVDQIIYIRRASQKPIVLGKGGQTLKQIGEAARLEMQKSFGRRIHLFLHVKVNEKWLDEPARYRMMGLQFDQK